jgi:hypothetical protein
MEGDARTGVGQVCLCARAPGELLHRSWCAGGPPAIVDPCSRPKRPLRVEWREAVTVTICLSNRV